MSSVIVAGDVSGSVTLQAPSASGTTVITLPTASGTMAATDTSGNLGIDVTPSAWDSGRKAIEFGAGNCVYSNYTNQIGLVSNAYYNGTNWIYKTTASAGYYTNGQGNHAWYNAPSGTAGAAATFTQAMTLTSGGNLELGTGHYYALFTGTDYGIELRPTLGTSGAVFASFLNNTGTRIGSISRNTTTNAVLYNTTSDERLKENIVDSDSVLETINNIKVRQYDWKDANVHQDYGFIAQELNDVISGVVTKPDDEELMWSVDYSKLTPHLVKAIQEQQALITSLTARLDALENK